MSVNESTLKFSSNAEETRFNQSKEFLKKQLDGLYEGQTDATIDTLISQLATCAMTFEGITPTPRDNQNQVNVPAQQAYAHNHYHVHHQGSDPLFWYMLGRHSHPVNYGWNQRYVYYYPAYQSNDWFNVNLNLNFGAPARDRDQEDKEKDSAAAVVVGLVAAAVVLADVAALAGGTYWTVMKSMEAHDANTRQSDLKMIADNFRQVTEGKSHDQEAVLKTIATHVENIGNREAKARNIEAVGTAFAATALVGTVHIIISAIAFFILSSYVTATSSAALLNAVAVFSFSCSPPILIAVAIIAAVGITLYAIHWSSSEQKIIDDRTDAEAGQMGLGKLLSLHKSEAESKKKEADVLNDAAKQQGAPTGESGEDVSLKDAGSPQPGEKGDPSAPALDARPSPASAGTVGYGLHNNQQPGAQVVISPSAPNTKELDSEGS